jgi:N-acetyl-anhydromuramyl-L-alanine amidase AmpD
MNEPKIFSTSDWGAVPPKQQFPDHPAKGIVIHNMENANRAPLTGEEEKNAAFQIARRNQHDHMVDRHWSDTGQHFTISRGGVIMEGRHGSLTAARSGKVVRGAHAGTNEQNTFWFGIELEGNNNEAFVVTDRQWAALVELCAWLSLKGNTDAQKIEPHNHFHDTTCPGHIVEQMQKLRDQVKQKKKKVNSSDLL